MKNCMKSNILKHTKTFPIASVEELNSLKALIDESNEKEYITSIRAICGQGGLRKGLREVIKPDVLNLFNVEGSHNKHHLLNFPKFLHVVFAGTYYEESNDKSFKAELINALKLAKNKHCKEKKKKCSNSEPTTSSQEEDLRRC